jgi:sarcosine oxidase subunit beta
VTGITVHAGKVGGVMTAYGEHAAPIVVNAAGPWAGALNGMVGLDLPLDTWRHDTMFVRRPQGFGPAHLTVIDAANEMYFRPEGDHAVGLEDGNLLGEPWTDTIMSPGFAERGIERLIRRIRPSSTAACTRTAL